MEFIALIEQNLLTPPILFFALGVLAGIIKSDLEVPESISRYLALYLMMAIGFILLCRRGAVMCAAC